ncbi:MAG: MATE family efflux transporter [Pseudomonadota bacterium]|nr:MATE family efflux transporter [Pseudomonadota bacterium]
MSNPYGNKAIWLIAGPMMLSGISIPLLGLVDTAVMGHLSDAKYLAAVAVGSNIFGILFMSLNFLRMGTTGLTAQAFGEKNQLKQVAGLKQPLIISLVISVGLILFQYPILELALIVLGPGENVSSLTREYFTIRIYSAPFALANYVVIGWLLGMQNARGPLIITLVLNGANILMDLIFVVGMGMTVDGVAIATLIAEFLALITGTYFVINTLKKLGLEIKFLNGSGGVTLNRIFDVNGSLFIRSVTLMFIFAFITAQGARIDTLTLATNALLMNFLFLLAYGLDGIACAAEALSGKAFGEKNILGLKQLVRGTLRWSIGLAALFTLLYFGSGKQIIEMLSSIQDVQESAEKYLPWLIFLPSAAVLAFLYDGIFVGLTRAREMCLVMLLSACFVFLPCWYFTKNWGNHSIWFALIAFMSFRSIGMHALYSRLIEKNLAVPSETNHSKISE